jgi:hypothetical protein
LRARRAITGKNSRSSEADNDQLTASYGGENQEEP